MNFIINIKLLSLFNMIVDKKITIIPKLLVIYINNIIKKIKGDIIVDQDKIRKNIQLYTINEVEMDLKNLFNNNSFWKDIMNISHCDFRFEDGKFKGTFCNKPIYIICDDGKNHGKCYRHISTKYYKKYNKKDPNKLCISLNHAGGKCGSYKAFGEFCVYHKYKLFDNEIKLLLNIDIDKENDIIYQKYLKKINIEKEIGIFNNIEYIIPYTKDKCDNDYCFNNVVKNEDFCKKCLDIIYDENDSVIYEAAVDNLDIYFKEVIVMNSCIEDILYNKIFYIKSNEDRLIDDIDNIIEDLEITKDKTLEKKIKINLNNNVEIIKKILEEKTYINISFLENILYNYNKKIKDFKMEISIDLPLQYKRIKGYIDILEQDIELNIMQKIEIAKIKSSFLF